MILIQQYFISDNPIRQKEIDETLEQNIKNPLIKEINLLNEKRYNLKHKKIKQFIIKQKLTYTIALKYARKLKNKVIILAYSDIYFDNSLSLIQNWNSFWDNKIICVTRHEVYNDKIIDIKTAKKVNYYKNNLLMADSRWTQDAWIFKSSQIMPFICDTLVGGVLGCEGDFTYKARKNNIDIINGYPYIKAIHNHHSNHRTYDYKNIIISPEGIAKIKFDIFGNKTSGGIGIVYYENIINNSSNLNEIQSYKDAMKFLSETNKKVSLILGPYNSGKSAFAENFGGNVVSSLEELKEDEYDEYILTRTGNLIKFPKDIYLNKYINNIYDKANKDNGLYLIKTHLSEIQNMLSKKNIEDRQTKNFTEYYQDLNKFLSKYKNANIYEMRFDIKKSYCFFKEVLV